MIKSLILLAGFILLIILQYSQPVALQSQFLIFITGIILLGVPHGAADLLVATRNAEAENKYFSKLTFFINYLLRLGLFALILWLFPLAGNVLFILFAAYHFGETDLHQFKTNTVAGKLFVISYGMVILAIILLHHFEEVKPLLQVSQSGIVHASLLNFLDQYRYTILSFFGVFFLACTFFYFLTNKENLHGQGLFLIQFILICFILYNLPMLLGFSFYFIAWHSILSLQNIINYLRKDNLLPAGSIARQMSLYSILAMVGITLFGLTGSMFLTNHTMMVYIFLGLAVLTAPHMHIMQRMYNSIRSHQKI